MSRALQSIRTLESVLDLAVELEKRGQAFYESSAKGLDDQSLQELFADLAAEEQKHGEGYRQLFQEVTGSKIAEEQLVGEYGRFIEQLIGEITDALEIPADMSPIELIDLALRFEKDTLLYFNEIKTLFNIPAAESIEMICTEERAHITRLLKIKQGLGS